MIWENIKMAFRSIAASKLRTALTMLGLIIGISSVVVISAIGEGVKKSVSDQVTGLGANVIAITPGQLISNQNGNRSFNPAATFGASTLTPSDIDTIRNLDKVKGATPFSLISGIPSYEGKTSPSTLISGTNSNYLDLVVTQKLESGRFFRNDEEGKFVAVLGPDVKTALLGSEDAIGKKVSIRNQEFEVIGVIAKEETTSIGGNDTGNVLYMPLGTAKILTGSAPSINRIIVQGKDTQTAQQAAEQIKQALLQNHGNQEDFSVLTQKDILSTFDQIFSLLTTFVSAIASIALLVGGIGIMNIMLVSVTERTREVGLRKALGATGRTILGQFLIEAIVLCIIGGLLGIGLAYAAAYGVGKLANIEPILTMQAIGYAVGTSVAVGVIFGIAPAIKAARMRPIEALRHE
jgi:putative ABC transport system permease protein